MENTTEIVQLVAQELVRDCKVEKRADMSGPMCMHGVCSGADGASPRKHATAAQQQAKAIGREDSAEDIRK